jgi:fatty-acyl-CoA synthase
MAKQRLVVGQVFRQAAMATPDRQALIVGTRSLTFKELDATANRYAHTLRSVGIGYGDRVSWWSDTVLEAGPLFVALAKLGAIAVPFNVKLEPPEVVALVDRIRPRLVLVNGARAEQLAPHIPLAQLARLDEGSSPAWSLPERARQASDADIDEPRLQDHDPHIVFFTSGTTGGGPKAAVIPHAVSWLRSFNGSNPPQPPSQGRLLTLFPQSSMGGWHLPMINWQERGTVIWAENAEAETALDLLQRHRVTRLQTLPALWQRIMDADPSRFDLSALRYVESGTTPTGPDFIRRLREHFPGRQMRIFYGSTEAGTLLTLADADVERKAHSVGIPVPGIDLRWGQGGELQARSAFNFAGYLDDPDNTATAFDGEWYRTGDLAAVDEEGYFRLTGRVSEVIRTAGQWVSPWEVDEVLLGHPDIEDVAAFGVPDEAWGEVVCAAIKPRRGRQPSLEDLRAFCRGRLASFKHPRRIEFTSHIPRTDATGKVMRAAVRARYMNTSGRKEGQP